jgi:hypothetical protein
MESLISRIDNPSKQVINLIKLPSGEVVNSPSKWLSDRWFLRQTKFQKNLKCVEISPFRNPERDSNVFVGEKYLGHKVIRSLQNPLCSLMHIHKEIDFLSIIDPDHAFEFLQKIDFSKHKIKHFCIGINPLKEKDFKQNRRKIKGFMKDKANLVKQNRTELLYGVI